MKATTLLKAAGLLVALPLAMLPVEASAFDHCPPARQYVGHSTNHGHHGGHSELLWPGDRPRVGHTYLLGHTRYVARPVHVVQIRLVAPAAAHRRVRHY